MLSFLRVLLNIAVWVISRIPPEQWAKLGEVILSFLTKLQTKTPDGNPAVTTFAAFSLAPPNVGKKS